MIWQESLCLQWWGPGLWIPQKLPSSTLQRPSRQLVLLQLPHLRGNLMRFWHCHCANWSYNIIPLNWWMMVLCSKAGGNAKNDQSSESEKYSPQIEKALGQPLLKKLKVNFELELQLKRIVQVKLNFHHERDQNLEPLNDTIPQVTLYQSIPVLIYIHPGVSAPARTIARLGLQWICPGHLVISKSWSSFNSLLYLLQKIGIFRDY